MNPVKTDQAAEMVPLDDLRPWGRNPRRNKAAVEAVARSIRRFGFGAPLLARRANNEVIAGHTRLLAARAAGLDEVPVRFMDLDEAEAHALAMADNKLGDLSEWDPVALADMLAGGVDLLDLGWSEVEVAQLDAGPPSEGGFGGVNGTKLPSPQRSAMVTLLVSTDDVATIEAAIELAARAAPTRGQALATICREWARAWQA